MPYDMVMFLDDVFGDLASGLKRLCIRAFER